MKKHILATLLLLASCVPSKYTTPNGGMGIPINLANDDYPMEIFYANAEKQPAQAFNEIKEVEVSEEIPLTKEQLKNKNLIYRGNDEDTKRLIVLKLIAEARKINADAIVAAKYTVYTTATASGSSMKGTAIQYK